MVMIIWQFVAFERTVLAAHANERPALMNIGNGKSRHLHFTIGAQIYITHRLFRCRIFIWLNDTSFDLIHDESLNNDLKILYISGCDLTVGRKNIDWVLNLCIRI